MSFSSAAGSVLSNVAMRANMLPPWVAATREPKEAAPGFLEVCSGGRDASRPDEPLAVVRAAERDDLDVPSGLRCVHHPVAPEVEADVPQPGEEQYVARLHPATSYSATKVVEGVGAVGNLDTEPA